MKKILLWIKGLFFGNVQILAARDNAEQTHSVIKNEPVKHDPWIILTLSQMRDLLKVAFNDEIPKEQRLNEI